MVANNKFDCKNPNLFETLVDTETYTKEKQDQNKVYLVENI